MTGIAKSILIAMIVAVCLMIFTQFIYFFPSYMTMVIETFNLSQIAASDNYIKNTYLTDSLRRLESHPNFSDVKIDVTNADGSTATGYDDETLYEHSADSEKPYRQRGNEVQVEVSALYRLSITLWGTPVEEYMRVSFTLTTTGLKHYKDLAY